MDPADTPASAAGDIEAPPTHAEVVADLALLAPVAAWLRARELRARIVLRYGQPRPWRLVAEAGGEEITAGRRLADLASGQPLEPAPCEENVLADFQQLDAIAHALAERDWQVEIVFLYGAPMLPWRLRSRAGWDVLLADRISTFGNLLRRAGRG